MDFRLVPILMTLKYLEQSSLPYIAYHAWARSVEVDEDRPPPNYQRRKDSPESINFSDVQIVAKFAV